MSENVATWLPNLIGGVSIWKIAADLNESHMFGGRLLTPETEGSDSLPTRVEWRLTGLVPLDQARAQYGAECEAAIGDFQACLKKVAKEFADETSGYHKYRSAFTVPSIEAAGSPNYFYDPKAKKVVCINWGASPRIIGGSPGQFVYDHAAWGDLFGAGAAGAVAGAAAAAAAPNKEAADAPDETKKDEEKPEEKKDEKKKPLWPWLLAGLAFLGLLALILFLLKACEDQKNAAQDGGLDAQTTADSAVLAETGSDASISDAASADGASSDASTDASDADAHSDASASDAGDAGDASAAIDAANDDDIDVDDDEEIRGSSSGGGSSGGKGEIHIYTPKGTKSKAGPHRVHLHQDATAWRVTSGMPKVARTQAKGKRYDVWLKSGQTFDGVKVEWQDKTGKWHAH